MRANLGTVKPGSTIYIPFDTYDKDDGSSITMTGLAVTDIEVYKDGGTTQRASDSGYTLLDTDGIDFDALTGIHGFSISLADNSTAGFWAAGSRYFVVVSSITVDAVVVSFIAAEFYVGYPNSVLDTTIATLSTQTSFTLTTGPAEDDALNGMWVLIHDVASAVQLGWAQILDYTGATRTVTLAAGTTFTAAATDNISVMGPTPLQPTVLGRTVDVSAGGEAGLDWANIGSPTTVQNLSSTNIDVDQIVASVSGAVGSVTGAVGSVAAGGITAASIATDAIDADAIADNAINAGAIATGAITSTKFAAGAIDAAAIATDAITAAKIAADAIGDSELAADAVTAIQSGLATSSALTTLQTDVTTLLGRITSTLFSGITSLAQWLGLIAGKQVGDTTARTELRATGAGSGAYDETTDSQEAARDNMGIAQTGDSFARLGAAGTGLTAVPWNATWDAEVQSEVQDAIEVNHLDHLLAVDYDPAAKPGVATALLNELVESDAGVSRYTANALEQAPTGAGGDGSAFTAIPWNPAWDAEVESEVDDALGGGTGTALTGIPWNAAWDAEVQSEADDALVARNLDKLISDAGTAQAGGPVTITLRAGALPGNLVGVHMNSLIYIYGGAGIGQLRHISSYNGTTKVATVLFGWFVEPDSTSQYVIFPWGVDQNSLLTYLTGQGGLPLTVAERAAIADKILARNVAGGADSAPTVSTTLTDIPTNSELATSQAAADDATLAAIAALNNLSSAQVITAVTASLTTGLTEGYRATGAIGSVRDLLYEILAGVLDHSITGTVKTSRKIDGTTAKTYTLDHATLPTSITEAT